MSRTAGAAVAVGLLASLALTACTGGSGTAAHQASASPAAGTVTGPSTHLVATRWWSNTAVQAGSTIDPKHPAAAASKLHTSRADYCSMLKQTVAAGKSILPGVSAGDPALLASTRAFVGEVRAVAPSEISGAWKTFGDAVVALVESGGNPKKVTGLDPGAVQKASTAVAADAKSRCHVDLSAKPTK